MSNINKDAVLNPFFELTGLADQIAQDVTDITQQLAQDKAAFTQEIQDALVYLENAESVASALRTPRKIQTVPFDGTQDINLPVFTSEIDGLVPKRVGATTTKYLREDGGWVTPPNTTYTSLTQANAEAGTATTANTISAKVLKDAIKFHAPPVTDITGNAATATNVTGTVEIANGGTGATTPAAARTNLDVYSKAETDNIASIPNATIATAGKAKIATTALAQEGINNTDFITAKKLRDALNASGSAPIYACRAWVSVYGITATIQGSGNVFSITKNSTGDYTVTFNTKMQDSNYAVCAGGTINTAGTTPMLITIYEKTAESFKVRVYNSSFAAADPSDLYLGVFR